MNDRIYEALHEATYVHITEFYIYVWHNGSYVNIYDQYFNETGCFSCANSDGSIFSINKIKLQIEKHNHEMIQFFNKG